MGIMVRAAMIVPEYNEASRSDMNARLEYFDAFSSKFRDVIDVLLVDDSSTDDSQIVIRDYVRNHSPLFSVLYKEVNGNKVGALRDGVAMCDDSVDTILLTDFDSSVPFESMDFFNDVVDRLHKHDALGGMALRVDAGNCDTHLGFMQQLEYKLSRAFHYVARKEGKTRCIAGAGGLWKRDVLESLFRCHSGRHNGDDMELTALAMREGWNLAYEPLDVITTVPEDIGTLMKQRTRWELGALETYTKEWEFYGSACLNAIKAPFSGRFDHFGFWTAWQIGTYFILPYGLTQMAHYGSEGAWDFFAKYLAMDGMFMLGQGFVNRDEVQWNVKTMAGMIALPFYNLFVQYPSRTMALGKLIGSEVRSTLKAVVGKNCDPIKETS